MKRFAIFFLTILMLVVLVACDKEVCQHRDADDNSLCDKCDESYTDGIDVTDNNQTPEDSTPAPEHTHTWSAWTVTTPATCQAKGEETRTCACGEDETREIDALPHTWGDWITIAPATCVDKGAKMHICACGAGAAEEIPATSVHAYGTNNKCTECQTALIYTDGLKYILNQGGESYTVIGGAALNNATAVVIPPYHNGKPVTSIGSWAFYNCTSLTSIEIPESVTSIGSRAFCNCVSLTSIEIPKGVTFIGFEAFSCTSLTSIEIPAEVISIDERAFSECYSLASVTFADGFAGMLEVDVFYGCIKLTETQYGNCTYIKANDNPYFLLYSCDNRDLSAYQIHEDAKIIGGGVFGGCSRLSTIEIPESVTSIGSGAFADCTSLTSIEIPKGVTFIGFEAFYGCSLLNYTIYNNGKYLGNASNPYMYLAGVVDDSVTSFTISNTTQIIGTDAFYECAFLTSIEIPESVIFISDYAFFHCTSLTLVTFAETVGWMVISTWVEDGNNTISATDLADPATAATYLQSTYTMHYWYNEFSGVNCLGAR